MFGEVVIVKTGIANLGSIIAALARLGVVGRVVTDPEEVRKAKYAIVPGVGHFNQAIQFLRSAGLDEAVKHRVATLLPTMFVCVGVQLLGLTSEEGDFKETGLGVIPGRVLKFPAGVHVPQQGWNKVVPADEMRYVTEGFAYFSNSFAFTELPAEVGGTWTPAYAKHGISFVAAIENGPLLATQFHPELSGLWGHEVLSRWLTISPTLSGVSDKDKVQRKIPASLDNSKVTNRLIPCLDVKDGVVVKGIKFQNLVESGSPSERAALYQQQGADELVVLDVSATVEARKTRYDTVKSVRAVLSIPLCVGGGVTSVADAQALLEAGADKVSINSAAVKDPSLLTVMAENFGQQCTVVAIDAMQTGEAKWEVVVKSGKERTGIDVVEWSREAVKRGAGEILLTSWDRDGTKSGYDLPLLKAVSSVVNVPVIASGGAAKAVHLKEALEAGADAVLAASIFHYAEYTVAQIKDELTQSGINIRK